MNMKTTVTITKFPETFGDLQNMKPAGYGTTQVPEGEMPFEDGVPMQDPATQKDRDLWQRKFLMLHDVPMPTVSDWGKAIMLVVDPSGQYNVKFDFPGQLANPRNFSITGDGTAPAVAFNGLNDVVLNLTNLVAEKWKTARTITFAGTGVTGSFTLDGSANVTATLTVGNAATASKWATARTITVTGADASGNFSIDGSANVNFPVTVNQAPKWTTPRTLTLTGNATGSVNWDGSANASITVTVNQAANATNATNATNAVNATTAATANALANGALTVNLTGGATGSGSISGGVVNIPVTVAGGGGSTGGTGYATLGKNTFAWGSVTTDASGNATIPFPVAYLTSAGYTYTTTIELSPFAGSINVPIVTRVTRTTTSVSLRVLEASTGNAVPGTVINYSVIGQTAP